MSIGLFELIAGREELRELGSKIELDEPSDDATQSILARHIPGLETESDVVIPESVQERSATLTSSFLLNERQAAKPLRVLRLTCEEAAFKRMKARYTASCECPSLDTAPSSLDPLLTVLARMEGVGKTEPAKRLAEIDASTRRVADWKRRSNDGPVDRVQPPVPSSGNVDVYLCIFTTQLSALT